MSNFYNNSKGLFDLSLKLSLQLFSTDLRKKTKQNKKKPTKTITNYCQTLVKELCYF